QDPPPSSSASAPRDRTASGGSGPAGVFPAAPPRPASAAVPDGTPAPNVVPPPKPPVSRGRPPAKMLAFWDKFYATHDESPADLLYLRGYYDQAAPLLDRAIETIPHRVEPLLMAMNLAQKTKDPQRMAGALERLLALGWPGRDEALRAEARRRAQALARTLRED